MNTLFIDTHLQDIDILIFNQSEILDHIHIENQKYNSVFLMPSIKEICDKYEFDQIVVVNGPGSFTGIRLGVTVAKTLAYTMEKPIKVLNAFDLLIYSLNADEHILAISDGNGYYIGNYKNYTQDGDLLYISNIEFRSFSEKKHIETNVAIDYKKVINHINDLKAVNPHSVKPIYVKLIGVENDKKN